MMKTMEIKREEAEVRQEKRKRLANQEQLNVLDNRLGGNVGANKERDKLNRNHRRKKNANKT